ncbi:hypothetical protein AAC387_Pa02g2680 [Persea americana]
MGLLDAIDGSRKWVFSGANGSDGDLGKGGVLFSPMGGNGGKLVGGFENNETQKPGPSPVTKDVVSSPKPALENKTHVSFFSQRNNHRSLPFVFLFSDLLCSLLYLVVLASSRFVLGFVKKKLRIPTCLIL